MAFNNIKELDDIVKRQWSELNDVVDYLNDAGRAKKEALQCVAWHLSFYDDLEEFMGSPVLIELSEAEGRHPEYYKTLRMISNAIARKINKN